MAHPPASPDTPSPTEGNHENAAARAIIAARHTLLDKEEESRTRLSGERPTVTATVYTGKHEESGAARHFTSRMARRCPSPARRKGSGRRSWSRTPPRASPTMRAPGGRTTAPPSCWAGYDLYEPKSAEHLRA